MTLPLSASRAGFQQVELKTLPFTCVTGGRAEKQKRNKLEPVIECDLTIPQAL